MLRFPAVSPGQTVGLFGGSFDPAHRGHVHVTREALKRFGLDRVWWLVSPGNPLKEHGPAPLMQRVDHANQIMQHPRVVISDIEARLGTRYTAETIAALQHHLSAVRFVWLMGADNLAQFHHWQDWQEIVARVPIGILARPGDRLAGLTARMPQVYRSSRLVEADSQGFGRECATFMVFREHTDAVGFIDRASTGSKSQRGRIYAPVDWTKKTFNPRSEFRFKAFQSPQLCNLTLPFEQYKRTGNYFGVPCW